MRGSPLKRTLVVLAALLLTGIGLARLIAPVAPPISTSPPRAPAPPSPVLSASFDLLLSGSAKRVTLDAGGAELKVHDSAGPLSGKLELSSAQPTLFLRVEWADAASGHRFAQLRLEIPGQPTRTHVFSAAGDIDDLWEP